MTKNKDHGIGAEAVGVKVSQSIKDKVLYKTRWMIARFASEADKLADKRYSKEECLKLFGIGEQFSTVEGNILVNAGINQMWTILCSSGGTKFDNTNAYLGVGDSTTAAAAGQTDLQAATNKLRKAMNGGFPTYGTSQKATWQSDFGSSEANYAWEEFATFNASSGGTMLNRKVSSQGTKTAGQTWQLSMEITLS